MMELLIAAAALLLLVVVVAGLVQVRRQGNLRRSAERLGMEFLKKGERYESLGLDALPLFARNDKRAVSGRPSHVLRGDLGGREALVFDFYPQRRGRRRPGQTLACFRVDPSLPELLLAPENVGHRLAERLGARDIDFPEHPEFSSAYHLEGADEQAVRTFLGHGGRIELLARHPGWNVETAGGWLVVYRRSRRASSPSRLPGFIAEAGQIAESFLGAGR